MKRVLLRIAYWINERYNTIEVKEDSFIRFKGMYFAIWSIDYSSELGKLDSLKIEAMRGSEDKMRLI